jgi:signal peptidase I
MPSVEAYWAALQGTPRLPRRRLRAGPMLGWAATALVVALALVYGAMRLADWRPLTIVTGSMRPAYSPGDLIIVSPQRASAVRPGEVITFAHPRRRGRTLTHRVVNVQSGLPVAPGWLAITTKGDANTAPERWSIRADGNVGRVRAHLPRVGEIAAPLGAGVPRGAAIGALTLLTASLALWGIWRR